MKDDKRKVALIGVGMVGASYAYALMNQNAADELVLIDIDQERARGEAMDLNHGQSLAPSSMRIYAGDYLDLRDADLAVLCAGAAQREGESRLDLLKRNAKIYEGILSSIVKSGFQGIFLVAVNPVDVMARLVQETTGFPAHRVIGTGTVLDTARLRYLMSEYLNVDSRNIHAYVIGEHGDSSFVPWSQAMVGTKPVLECRRTGGVPCQMEELEALTVKVREAAQEVIQAKRATYYAIGMVLVRITRAILEDENSVLTVSARLNGAYGAGPVYAGAPAIINRQGIREPLELSLTPQELKELRTSLKVLDQAYHGLKPEKTKPPVTPRPESLEGPKPLGTSRTGV